MEKIYQKSRLEYINAILFILLSYIAACAIEHRLFLFEWLFKKEISNFLLSQIPPIVALVAVFYGIDVILIEVRKREKVAKVVYDNICKEVFNRFIKPKGAGTLGYYRVSLFKAFDGHTDSPYLKVTGRYQIRKPLKQCKLKFKPGESCAGIAYAASRVVQRSIAPYDLNNTSAYYLESKNVFKLDEENARRLNEKACSFLCIPIKFFNEDEPWGILSIDSMRSEEFSGTAVRQIENFLGCISVFLMIE